MKSYPAPSPTLPARPRRHDTPYACPAWLHLVHRPRSAKLDVRSVKPSAQRRSAGTKRTALARIETAAGSLPAMWPVARGRAAPGSCRVAADAAFLYLTSPVSRTFSNSYSTMERRSATYCETKRPASSEASTRRLQVTAWEVLDPEELGQLLAYAAMRGPQTSATSTSSSRPPGSITPSE